MPRRFPLKLALSLLALAIALHGAKVTAGEGRISYNKDIRHILSDKCFYCHGPDEKNRKADLRLDLRQGATADLGGYQAITPGKPEESEVLNRVTSKDSKEMMPPPKSKKPRLTAKEVATLQQWIKEGAEYEGHWAFLPLSDAAPPQPTTSGWARNAIDQFILARLEPEDIQPSPEADRATLLRRVSLDLTGLLPTPEEIRAFQEDQEPNAYEKVVDRLLASPHYGERWGRHWLDQARYADSNGYSIDGERDQWPYRDWVIKALNDDMPFDQFTIEQLAGDLLPNATKSQLIATAFHRNTLINQEGGSDKEQFRVEAAMDRVNTTGAVWLGLTVGCAQCHTHKFDPIQQREYYEMLAFFNSGEDVNDKGATLKVAEGEVFGRPVPEPVSSAVATAEERAALQAEWEKTELARLEKRVAKSGATPAQWAPAKYQEYATESNSSFKLLPDNSLLSDQRGSANDVYRIVAEAPGTKVAAIRLRVLTHESLPKNGPGLASNGNFLLTDFSVTVEGKDRAIAKASADHEQADFPVGGGGR
jgi:mono/diheme cytochrome c family protein